MRQNGLLTTTASIRAGQSSPATANKRPLVWRCKRRTRSESSIAIMRPVKTIRTERSVWPTSITWRMKHQANPLAHKYLGRIVVTRSDSERAPAVDKRIRGSIIRSRKRSQGIPRLRKKSAPHRMPLESEDSLDRYSICVLTGTYLTSCMGVALRQNNAEITRGEAAANRAKCSPG